jgi:hypothetical protein
MEYVAMESLIVFLAVNVFYQMHYASGLFPTASKVTGGAALKKKQR